MRLKKFIVKILFAVSVTSFVSIALGQDSENGYIKIQYSSNRGQAEQILEDTRSKLEDMIHRRGGNPQTLLLTGDMVRNWKTAKQAFDGGDYAESIRICKIIQKYIF